MGEAKQKAARQALGVNTYMATNAILPLKVINLWGGPGSGKSTAAAGLFNLMKGNGHRVEYIPEFAKDLTYRKDAKALANQLYVLAVQDMRLRDLVDMGVEWAIVDSPLPMGVAYATGEYMPWIVHTAWYAWNRYDNYNFWIKRVKPYEAYGRNQTEEEARKLDMGLQLVYSKFVTPGSVDFEVDGDYEAPYLMAKALGLKATWDGVG
jgi:hypothetical protein